MRARCPYCQGENTFLFIPKHKYPEPDEKHEFDCRFCKQEFIFQIKLVTSVEILTSKRDSSGAV